MAMISLHLFSPLALITLVGAQLLQFQPALIIEASAWVDGLARQQVCICTCRCGAV